jgi:hypothetical protein
VDKLLGPKNLSLPQDVIENLYEKGALAVGMYCVIAKHSSYRGRSRITLQEIIEDSKLEEEVAREIVNWLWEEGYLEYHQIVAPTGEISESYFYVASQDRKNSGGD